MYTYLRARCWASPSWRPRRRECRGRSPSGPAERTGTSPHFSYQANRTLNELWALFRIRIFAPPPSHKNILEILFDYEHVNFIEINKKTNYQYNIWNAYFCLLLSIFSSIKKFFYSWDPGYVIFFGYVTMPIILYLQRDIFRWRTRCPVHHRPAQQ